MDTIIIKQEPIDIKEEPLTPEDSFEDRFDEELLVPKIEVIESAIGPKSVQVESSTNSLSCPKCHIRYYSAMSIKNHIQVCKKVIQSEVAGSPVMEGLQTKTKPRLIIKGVKKLPEDEKRSIRILEQSCFVNELNKDEGNCLSLETYPS